MIPDLDSIRQRVALASAKTSWRSLEELADSDHLRDLLHREFPDQAAEWADPVTRRRFLTLMGASLALAGVSGCSTKSAPVEKIMPYARVVPEEIVPGKPLYFATAITVGGITSGLLVESHEGRPTKIEGNPHHPGSLSDYQFGPTDLFGQASILDLYDPDRSQTVTRKGGTNSWAEVLRRLQEKVLDQRRPEKAGSGLRILSHNISSPTLAGQLETLLDPGKGFPNAKLCVHEPVGRDNAKEGAGQAFGRNLNAYYRLKNADVILALDADFLSCGPGHLTNVRDFMDRRRIGSQPAGQATMNRLYVVEPMPTGTGAKADHRLSLRAQDIESFARALAVGLEGKLRHNPLQGPANQDSTRALALLGRANSQPRSEIPQVPSGWIEALVEDLAANHGGRSLILVGEGQSPAVHALVHTMNLALGNYGSTVFFTDPLEATKIRPEQTVSLPELVKEMAQGQVEILIILGCNPAYSAPADVPFKENVDKVKLSIHLGLYEDETAALCNWHVPQAHYLESWSDARAFDGTASIVQPLIAPLYGGKTPHELLATFTALPERTSYDLVRDFWRSWWNEEKGKKSSLGGDFEVFWRKALHEGLIAETRFDDLPAPSLKENLMDQPPGQALPGSKDNIEIIFRPDPTIFDGRFANNGWLQELPKPITRLTWDNAAILSPRTAEELGLKSTIGYKGGEHGQVIVDVIELRHDEYAVEAPVWIQPGHADHSITIHLGYGRTRSGRVGGTEENLVGFSAYQIRTTNHPWLVTGLSSPRITGKQHTLANCQQHHNMENRDLVRSQTLDEIHAPHPAEPNGEAKEKARRELTLYHPEEFPYTGYRWGMAIDLTSCTGCSACVVACQAENNIPVVGKDQVIRGREMHWLRIDSYYEGEKANEPDHIYFQPVPCMQCENAPCELVCPVGATVHSQDGLNDMVYNRCVGTRYCSNNCPYKVRRFNFLQFADYATKSLTLLHNPEVTVRSRGVMEKCTYCVQRIRKADIEAEKRMVNAREQHRNQGLDPDTPEIERDFRIQDGEVLTACQAACPAHAIVFGDMNDATSEVSRYKAQPLNYQLLEELNTRPRTSYLAVVRNPNSKIPQSQNG